MAEFLKVSDLINAINESAKEFRAILGKNVDKASKEINDKAYKDIEKEVKNYDGGLRDENSNKEHQVIATNDYNKGMQDLVYDNGANRKDFKEKVKSQMKGYVSKDDENLHKNEPKGNAEYRDDLSNVEERHKELSDAKRLEKEKGIVGQNKKKEINNNTKSSVFENTDRKKMKQLYFKKTEFLNEAHITSKIPDEFKIESNRFIVKDKTNSEYLVEWSCNKANILQKYNKDEINEGINRIKELFNYKSNVEKSKNHKKIVNEDNEYKNILDNARFL